MSNQITQTKVAWIRNQNIPTGQPAPGHLNCPCGNAPETNYSPDTGNVTCTCSRVYTWNGYIIQGANKMFKIFFTNFGYYSQEAFDNLNAAIAYGKDKFFEFQVVCNDNPVYAWSVFGGGRMI